MQEKAAPVQPTGQATLNVSFENPRHSFENPLVVVEVPERETEWFFEVTAESETAVATAECVEFSGVMIAPTTDSLVPTDVAQALLEYDGTYGPVDEVDHPTTKNAAQAIFGEVSDE